MRILIVDDHDIVRRGISSLFASEPSLTVCGEAADGLEAVEKARLLQPDVVIMDISMPNMNGLDATREIKDICPQTHIIVVSQHETTEMMRQALQTGASAYVMKSMISRDLLPAITRAKSYSQAVGGSEMASPEGKNSDGQEIVRSDGTIENAFRKSESLFRAAMDSMSEGLYTIDAQGLLTYINSAAEAMFGWTADLLGQNMHDVMHYERPDGRPLLEAEGPLSQVLKTGNEIRELEDFFIRKDGTFFPVKLNASQLKDGEQIIGVMVCFRRDASRDIIAQDSWRQSEGTDRKEGERDLRLLVESLEARVAERTQELQSANDKLRDLSGKLLRTQDEERRRIARELHDGIGQLLAALSMNLSTLDSERVHLSADALRSLEESSRIIDQASKEIRTMSYLLHPPMLDEVGLESALRWYIEGFAERSKIAVQLQLTEGFSQDLPRDIALALFRIVQECLTNVHRHSGSATARVEISRHSDRVALEIQDRGKGIPPDIQLKIASGEGFGVGFRGMRERIRQFGGRMEITSTQDGTRLRADLPIPDIGEADEKLDTPDGDEFVAPSDGDAVQTNATILCIDDEAVGLLPRKLLLESAGHQVLEARSGPEGIRLFQSHRVDVVILDYWMSGMKGTTVAAELKRINPAVPIIVLSGMSDLPGEAAGLIDQWLVKGSHKPEQLLDSISNLIERRPV